MLALHHKEQVDKESCLPLFDGNEHDCRHDRRVVPAKRTLLRVESANRAQRQTASVGCRVACSAKLAHIHSVDSSVQTDVGILCR